LYHCPFSFGSILNIKKPHEQVLLIFTGFQELYDI